MSRPTVLAVQPVRKLRGGSQAHLLRASDGRYYVTKFQNNPQHVRVLANEFFASRIGISLGLPIPEPQLIEVSDEFIQRFDLKIEMAGHRVPFQGGLHLGSRYVADPKRDILFDYLPELFFQRVINKDDFARILAFDKWLGNCDGRQAVFTKKASGRVYHARFIDQGLCFNAEQWTFPDLALHGVYYKNEVYHGVTGWHSFEPVLSCIEMMEYENIWRCAAQIPLEWFEHDGEGLFQLIETLYKRRSLVRDLITRFRESSRSPFPRWNNGAMYVPCPARNRSSIESLDAAYLADVEEIFVSSVADRMSDERRRSLGYYSDTDSSESEAEPTR